MDKTFVLVIAGPTASGKTRLAVDLAKYFNGEIISADSMQIYKGMEIATAKPNVKEMQGVKHHLIGFVEPSEAFSAADYVKLAREKIKKVSEEGKLPIIAGGTGLYINSLINNIEFDDTGSDMVFRNEMKEIAERMGNRFLLEKLREIDLKCAEKLHENNLSRIIRALEVYNVSGKKMSDVQLESRKTPSPYEPLMFAIDYNPRELLYNRINQRVDEMLEAGLLEEAKLFYGCGDYPTAAQAIGYKELKPYLDGKEELSECVEKLKRETRKYAKRQLTWFKKDNRINWLTCCSDNLDGITSEYDKIFKITKKLIKNYGNKI